MATQFWVKTSGNPAGPFSSNQMRQAAKAGKLQPGHQVSTDREKWVAASTLKGLEFGSASLTSGGNAGSRACPACGTPVPSGTVICIDCGHDSRSGQRVSAKAESDKRIPGVPSSMPQDARVIVDLSFFPLAFFFYFCEPVIVIDKQRRQASWGMNAFNLPPGNHTIRTYIPYLFWKRCGDNSMHVTIGCGEVWRVSYWMPPWVFAKGSMKSNRIPAAEGPCPFCNRNLAINISTKASKAAWIIFAMMICFPPAWWLLPLPFVVRGLQKDVLQCGYCDAIRP